MAGRVRVAAVTWIVLLTQVFAEDVVKQIGNINFTCPEGWQFFGTSCYFPVSAMMEWEDAKETCKGYMSTFTTVGDEVENGALAKMATTSSWDAFWSGEKITDKCKGYWDNNEPPVSVKSGDCAAIQKNGRWRVVPCQSRLPFFCEKPACVQGTFDCGNGVCLNNKWVCDGINDCGNNLDEMDCASSCTFRKTNATGSVTYSNYPNNSFCLWTIVAPPGTQLSVTFGSFETEDSTDTLEVWVRGQTLTQSVILDKLSGTHNNKVVHSTNNMMILRFMSDSSVTKQGFQLTWAPNLQLSTDVNSVVASPKWALLYSPFYPSTPPSGFRREWLVSSSDKSIVTVEIEKVDLSPDWTLAIYNGEGYDDQLLMASKALDIASPAIYFSTNSKIRIILKAKDTSGGGEGFKLRYKNGCDVDVQTASGVIESPGFIVKKYPALITCTWTLRAPTNTSRDLKIRFLNFSLETGGRDILQVYNGSDAASPALHPNNGYTGDLSASLPTLRGGNILFVRFVSSVIQNNGRFKFEFSIDCPPIPDSPQMTKSSSDVSYESSVSITCEKGYSFRQQEFYLDSPVVFTCQAGGTWDKPRYPTCQNTYCGAPVAIEFGFVSNYSGQVTYGSKAIYECYPGFQLQGSAEVTCLDTGRWSAASNCTSSVCDVSPDVANSRKTSLTGTNDRAYGTIVEYTCDEGYEIRGPSRILCQKNTLWSEPMPSCTKKQCPLPNIENSRSLNASIPVSYQTAVTLTCETGYIASTTESATATLICGSNGTLGDVACKDKNECDTASTCESTQECVNSIGSYSCVCRSGYKTGASVSCVDIDECSEGTSGCEHKCENTEGSYSCTCKTGYSLFQNSTNGVYIVDGETGQKREDVYYTNHSCVRNTCPRPPALDNGMIHSQRTIFHFEDEITYSCNLGFTLSPNSTRVCQANRVWSRTDPNCTAAVCAAQQKVGSVDQQAQVKGIYPETPVGFRDKVIIECNKADGTSFNKTRFCAFDRTTQSYTLQGDAPECPVVDCGAVESIAGLIMPDLTSTVYGTTFTFRCDTGATVSGLSTDGNANVTCLQNGRWGYGNLTCQAAICPDPGTRGGTTQTFDSYEQGKTVKYECDRSGYTPTVPILTCVYNATTGTAQWDNEAPTCEDTARPTFDNCDNETVEIDRMTAPGFAVPTAQDNSGLVSVSVNPAGFDSSDPVWKNTTVDYVATDGSGNKAQCHYFIVVNDYSPGILDCPDRILYNATSTSTKYDITDKLTYSGGQLTFNPSRMVTAGLDEVGSVENYRITLTTDQGTETVCAFQVEIAAAACYLQLTNSPKNVVHSNFTLANGTIYLEATCSSGYAFKDGSTTRNYTCSGANVWSPSLPFEDCQRFTTSGYTYKAYIELTSSAWLPPNSDCINNFNSHYNSSVSPLLNNRCYLGGQLDRYYQLTITQIKLNTISIFDFEVNLTLRVENNDGDSNALDICSNTINNLKSAIFALTSSSCNLTVKADSLGVDKDRSGQSCDDGYQLILVGAEKQCLPCPSGTYYSSSGTCEACPSGQYQDVAGQKSCKRCGENMASLSPRYSSSSCIKKCQNGFISNSGNPPCRACPADTYWQDSTTCAPCPDGGSTLNVEGATNASMCKKKCPTGQYSKNGHEPCTPCPSHFYQDATGQNLCKECDPDKITVGTGSTSIGDCQSAGNDTLCLESCSSPGTVSCSYNYHKAVCTCHAGYVGSRCETEVDKCVSNPCLNGAVCKPGMNTYTCECPARTICNMERNQQRFFGITSNKIVQNSEDECQTLCIQNDTCKAAAHYTERNTCVLLNAEEDTNAKASEVRSDGPIYFDKICTYTYFFNGTNCENDLTNNCENHHCSKNSMCRDLINDSVCICPSGGEYTKPRCEPETDLCGRKPCQNGGTCNSWSDVRYQCTCPPGYEGNNCQTPIDDCKANPSGCLYGGDCEDGVNSYSCTCKQGFNGDHCESEHDFCPMGTCSDGLCVNNYVNITADCICEWPFEKDANGMCSRMNFCSSNPCRNSTYTQRCESLDNGYRCVCEPGYEGSLCQHNIDDCADNPCAHGTCIDEVESYSCECDPGWTGTTCNVDVVDCGQCDSTGTDRCEDLNQDYSCICKPGYKGRNCTEEVNECDSLPCQHGGTCVDKFNDYSCNCTTGWEGKNCQDLEDTCSNVTCQNDGVCYNLYSTYFCSCQKGTQGLLCEDSPAMCNLLQPCTDKGTCQQSGGSATCNCSANTDYSGVSCQLIKDHCSDGVCKNGGACSLTQPMGYKCDCLPGYNGTNCEIVMDICQNKCPSGVTCLGEGRSTFCVCPANQVLTGTVCKGGSSNFDLFVDDRLDSTAVKSSTPFILSGNMTIMFWIGYFKSERSVIISNIDGTETYFELYEDIVTFSSGSQMANVTLESNKNLQTIRGQWDHVAVTWSTTGDYSVYINGLTSETGMLNFSISTNKLKRVFFDETFTGYISQLTVWDSILSLNDISASITNPSFSPSGELVLGWTSYSMTRGSRKYVPSLAGLAVKLCGDSPVKHNNCTGLPDKTRPALTPCPRADITSEKTNRVVLTSDIVTAPSANDGASVVSTLTDDAVTWGRYDIVYAAKDDTGNYGICRFKAYITKRRICSVSEFPNSETCGSDAFTNFCPTNQAPSVPTPNILPCSKRGSFNIEEPFELFVPPVCGVTSDYMYSLTVILTYQRSILCTEFTKTAIQSDVERTIINNMSPEWPGLCQGSCSSNMELSSTCDVNNVVVTVTFSNLPERIRRVNNGISLKPDEIFLTTAQDESDLDLQGTGTTLQKNNVTVRLRPSCAEATGTDKCITCGSGSYFNSSQKSCMYCPVGTYSDTPSKTFCLPCTGGTTTLREGARASAECVVTCQVGKYFVNNACELCPRGFYQNRTGQSFCYPCAPHKKTRDPGTDSPDKCFNDCPSGTELQEDGSCKDCPQGYYRALTDDSCQQCSNGNTTEGPKTTSSAGCILPSCNAGNYINDQRVCVPCPIGEYQPIKWQRSCLSCSENYTTTSNGSVNSTECKFICPKGQEESATQMCVPCPVGKYRDNSLDQRFIPCQDCPANFTTPTNGTSSISGCSIRICLKGSYRNATDNKCYKCPVGQFQPDDQQTRCQTCRTNYTTQSTGSVNETQCQFFCADGYQIQSAELETCEICPRGTYRSNTDTLRFLRCQNCRSRKTTNSTGAKVEADCALEVCTAGQRLNSNLGACIDCPLNTYQPVSLPMSTTTCLPCDAGNGTKGSKSTAKSDCLSFCNATQQVGENGLCEACPQGTWNDGSEQMRFLPCKACSNSNFTTRTNGSATAADCTLRNCDPGYKIKSGDCEPCGFGKYQPQHAQDTCFDCGTNFNTSTTTAADKNECSVSCPPGEQGQEGNCSRCPNDTYKDVSGYAICKPCTGSVTSDANRTDCTVLFCDKGVGYKSDTNKCEECEKGFYKDTRGNTVCTPCPKNFTTAGPATKTVAACDQLNCEPGFFAHNTAICTPCPVGYYKSTVGKENCTKCADDRTTVGMASTNPAQCTLAVCPAGQYRTDTNACEKCPKGQYQPNTGATSCLSCEEGYTTQTTGANLSADCQINCTAGKYRSARDACSDCEIGRYQPNTGADTCLNCTAGYTTRNNASKAESDCFKVCLAGLYHNGTSCNECPRGQYQPDTNQMSCLSCEPNYTTLQTASKSSDQCMPQCGAGKYLNVTSRTCINCPLGTYLSTGGTDQNCVACPEGKTTSETGSTLRSNCDQDDCNAGYYNQVGKGCQACGQGFYQPKRSQTSCIKCGVNETTRLGVTNATSKAACIRDCNAGSEYNIWTKECDICPVGKIRIKSMSDFCTFCPRGQTTKREGATVCEEFTTDPGRTPAIETLTMTILFELKSCQGINLILLEQNIQQQIKFLILTRATVYPGLCIGTDCSNVVIVVFLSCDSGSRVKRQVSGPRNFTVEVTASNLPSQIANTNNTLRRSGESLLLEALGDESVVNKELSADITYLELSDNITTTVSCPAGSLKDSNNNCVMCELGTRHNSITSTCEPCPVGQYQDKLGQTTCKTCNGKLSTRTEKTNNISHCLSLCIIDPDYCQNQGTCENIGVDEIKCQCTEKYTGDRCTIRLAIESQLPTTIIGVCVGVFLFLILILTIGWICRRRRSRQNDVDKMSVATPPADYMDYQFPPLGVTDRMRSASEPVAYPNMAYHDVYDFYQTDDWYSDR